MFLGGGPYGGMEYLPRESGSGGPRPENIKNRVMFELTGTQDKTTYFTLHIIH